MSHPIVTPEMFHTITIDYVTGLPTSRGKDAIITITEKMSKAIKIIPCTKTVTAAETAHLYLKYAYSVFSLPEYIISDCDARFTSYFWRTLIDLLDVCLGLIAAYHSNTDS